MKAVDRALREGTMNGKEHTKEEIEELKASGTYKRRYRKWYGSNTFRGEDIMDGVREWSEEHYSKEPSPAPSLHHHCTITAPSPHHPCTITAPSPHHHCSKDDGEHGTLALKSAPGVLEENLPLAMELEDLYDHNVKGRKRPGEKHDCQPVFSTRGAWLDSLQPLS